MAKANTDTRPRAPQGAKRVAQAFFNELKTIAEDKQAEVAKTAQAMVRETMMGRREQAKTAKAKLRAGRAVPATSKVAAEPARKPRGPNGIGSRPRRGRPDHPNRDRMTRKRPPRP